jgi:thiol-disulfide isomerase/thioredoxin
MASRAVAGFLLLTLAAWFVCAPVSLTAEPAGDGIELKTVKYDGLVQAVQAQRGKVVVMDIWGEFCVPCKKGFPHLVEMHRRYADKGLVCMSVSLDEADDKEAVARALAFLKQKKATFPNYLLAEDAEVWQDKWKLKAPPAIFVFDRLGRRAAKFSMDDPSKQFTYEEVEKLVQKLLDSSS